MSRKTCVRRICRRESVVDCGLGQPAAPLAERPSPDRVLLRLHGAEVAHDGGRAAGQRAHEALVEQPLPRELEPWVGSPGHHAAVASRPCTG